MPEAFTDPKEVTKSHVPTVNAPLGSNIPGGQPIINELKERLKRGRPIGSKNKNPRKRKITKKIDGQVKDNQEKLVAPKEPSPEELLSPEENIVVTEEAQVLDICENNEISINYVMIGIQWDRNEVNVDGTFAYHITYDVMNDNKDHEPKSINEFQKRKDWPIWKDVIDAKLKSLAKRKVFGPIVHTPEDLKPIDTNGVFDISNLDLLSLRCPTCRCQPAVSVKSAVSVKTYQKYRILSTETVVVIDVVRLYILLCAYVLSSY
ncbi:hypothetical protein K1719_014504 [Acacia pycnantha]|nr:hypothetical protein K1719_014504 [Acacia pycnantha]